MVDSSLAFTITARDLGASAVFDKVARSADKTSGSLSKTVKVSAEAQKASEALTKAQDKQNDILGKVAVAEKRLQEVRANSNSKASQIVAAENNLAKARRDAARAGTDAEKAAKSLGGALESEGKQAGKSLGKSILHWFTGAGKDFEKAGQAAGEATQSGIVGVLKTPVIGPAIIAGALVGVTAAATPLGAILAGGIVAGFGAGIAGIGLKFAAESEVVKRTWKATVTDLGAQMRTISTPFQSTLVAMADSARRTFATFKPELAAAFKDLAPAVTAFGDQLGSAFAKLAPAIQPLAGAFSKVLGALGPGLNDMIAQLSSGLTKLSASVSKNPTALADFARGVGGLTSDLLSFIGRLNDADAAFKRLTGISSVTALMGTLRGAVQLVVGPINALATGFTKLSDLTKPVGQGFVQSATTAKEAATATGYWTQGMTLAQAAAVASGGAVAKSAHETHQANVEAALAAGAFARQTAATNALVTSLNLLSSRLLSLSGAQIAYQQAIDDTTAAIKANGKTHDINTQKGRDNQTALNNLAQAAIAQRDAMLKANDGNVKAAASAVASRASFVKLAQQMGYSKTEAQSMAKQLIAIPNVTRTAKLQANIQDLQSKLATAKGQLADKNLTATKRAKLEAEISRLQAGIAAAKAALASVPASKTTTINVVTKYSSTGVNLTNPSSVGRRASGGPVKAGQPYIVGEKRPELFVPNQNGTIIPKVPAMGVGADLAAGMAAGISGGGGTAVSAVAAMANSVIDKAKQVLGISSPSKVFAQLALYVNQGFSNGIRGSAKQVQSAYQSLISKVINIAYTFQDTKKSLQKTIDSYEASINAARKRIKPITSSMTKSEVAAAKRNNAAAEASISNLQKKLKSAKSDMSSLLTIGGKIDTAKERNRVVAILNAGNKQLQAYANARAKVAAQLQAAQTKLADAIKLRDDFKKSIVDASIAFNSITNVQPDENGTITASAILGQMSDTLRKTQNFAANLAKLKAKGLNSTLYQQLAEAGAGQGGDIAAALLGGGQSAINAANSLQAQINTASNNLGTTASKNLYQAGVDSAQGLVNGLLAKTKALDAASKKLADAIVARIKKELGIRSPSRVLAWHGQMVSQGFASGIVSELPTVQKAAAQMSDITLPSTRTRRGAVGSGSNGGEVITVPVQLTLDGRVIQQSLLKLKRVNGGVSLGFE